MWSSDTLSTVAASALRLVVGSSWKLDNSRTHTWGAGAMPCSISASASSTGRPILPATQVVSPAVRHMSPHIEVTVLLPLLPVMAITRIGPLESVDAARSVLSAWIARANSSTSPTTSTPAATGITSGFGNRNRRRIDHHQADRQQAHGQPQQAEIELGTGFGRTRGIEHQFAALSAASLFTAATNTSARWT